MYSLEDGIEELIKTYSVLISDLSSKYRNGFPLGYEIGLYIIKKEAERFPHLFIKNLTEWSKNIIQPSVYHEQRGEISTTYHSDYYDRLIL